MDNKGKNFFGAIYDQSEKVEGLEIVGRNERNENRWIYIIVDRWIYNDIII
ncbi:MAG: hypothetical protein WD512_14025 [Candidatus Paceibacterota bacterium]